MIQIISSSRYKISRKFIKQAATDILLNRGIGKMHLINIIFIGRNKMKMLSTKYKQEDLALPVLSFRYDEQSEDKKLLGEIFICYPQAVLLAAERGKKVNEMILSLIRHGIENILNNEFKN